MAHDLGVIIPFRDRPEWRLELAIRSIANSRGELDAEVIIVDYGSRKPYKLSYELVNLESVRVIRVEADFWDKSDAINHGIKDSDCSVYLISDADLIWPDGTIPSTYKKLMVAENSMIAFDVRYLRENTPKELIFTDKYDPADLNQWADLNPRWGDGICMVRRDDLLRIGGYDLRYSIYGYEDNDLTRRLRATGIRTIWADFLTAPVYHVWHVPVGKVVSVQDPAVGRAYRRNKQIFENDFSVVRNTTGLPGDSIGSVPLVSVVIATSGRSELLETAICSVLCQTVQDFEIIVVDDGCLDNTEEVVDGFSDPRIRYFGLSEQRGISYARNFGGGKARGEFIAVMDDDDISLPNRFEDSIAAITRGLDGCVGGFITFHNEDGKVYSWDDPFPDLQGAFAQGGFAGHPTWFLRREVFQSFSYDESFTSAVDNNIAMRMLVSGVRMTHMGKPAILRRVHEGQVTNKDSQFQGFGAKLNKTWLWSGYNRDAYNTLVVESKKKAPKNAARLYEIEYLPYLPDNLVSRTVDVDIWSQDELNFVKKLEGTSEILTVCDSGGNLVFGRLRTVGTWRNMARLSQQSLHFAITGFETTSDLTARHYVPERRAFARAVPWKEVLQKSDEQVFNLEYGKLVKGLWEAESYSCNREKDSQTVILNDQPRKRYHYENVIC
ncbi:glycosyltransferase family 2 protein [Corynebacterium glucuronolyticum]|uniref:Glycosyltransferase family 2 protein n=4 Tax=Corynebacterium glucuronolyticum TaxID=39791 RepID=A0AAX1L772_9CORY|nr:glycosyltransferase [Corynebacterium glucuronolyticum]QRP70043.1 glycosyltransferase family 2 protein [Corynebacterium glucuronolyticum]